MRKNLFLTLALVLASFASAVAQNWSVTLSSSEGLPGSTASKDGVSIKYFKSGIITVDKATRTLRFTCAGNSTNHKPNGNNFRMMLSELNVYSADDLTTELNYTVTSNADHNSLAKAFDGQGLRALNDGKYNNYFSSMSAEENQEKGIYPVTDYHYLELTFEKAIDRFVIEWGGKAGSGEAPSVVVLTKGGQTAEPFSDRSSSFSETKITTLENLKDAEYFTICGNAATSYDIYHNNNNEGKLGQLDKEGLTGSGPMYVTLGEIYAEAPTIDYLTQLVAAGNGKYYIYFPMQKKYLSGDAEQNALNDALNGWQYATSDESKAAKITLTSLVNGDFEMSYVTKKNGADVTVYIGADPRTGKMKIFETAKKKALEANGWCEGFGIICAFNWSFYAADYTAPTWAKEYELGIVYIAAEEMKAVVKDNGTLAGVISTLNALMNDGSADMNDILDAIAEAKEKIGYFMYKTADNEITAMEDQWEIWKFNSSSNYVAGKWSLEAYNTYIQPGIDALEELVDAEEDAYYDHLDAFMNYFTKKEANIAAFEDAKYEMESLPLQYTTDGEALGTKDGNAYIWEQSIGLKNAVNGIRITFLETNVGSAAGGGKWNGYPMVALGDLQIYDNNGNEINIVAASTNSQETSEGPIENLTDGDNATFWHSIWGNGTMNPQGYVYLDIQFEKSLEAFKIKSIGRNNASLSPKTVAISEYGTGYNEGAEVANPYNVRIGAQVTNVANLKDGGLYVLQGNLYVKRAENAANPRFYAGAAPYTDDKNIAADAPTVYMFKKAADGTWNILSLNKGMFWVKEPDHGTSNLVLYQTEAGGVKFTSSNNIANAFVIYRDITPEVLKGKFSDADAGVEIPETDITVSKLVYMDWESGLASRPCYSELPGVVAPGCETLTDELKVTSAAGDYLHFNKTNGEGEWNIYEVTMNDADFVYLSALVGEVDKLNLKSGNNPGCIDAKPADMTALDNAKAAAQVAVDTENKGNAKTLATNLLNAVEKLKNSQRIGFVPSAVYQIQNGLNKYEENTWATRSLYADFETSTLKWTVTPDNFGSDKNNFLFRAITIDEEINTVFRLGLEADKLGKTFIIKVFENDLYASAWDEATNDFLVGAQPAAYFITDLGECDFEVRTVADNKYWHTEGHNNGNGYEGRLVNWNCGNNLNTASSWTFIKMDKVETSIEDLVIEGDEVVSVSYFTPAGMALPAPVKGINIVVTVYANGVVEAKKKVVK